MIDERSVPTPGSVAVKEPPASPEREGLESEYGRCVRVLNKTGIVSLLPYAENLGVVGVDGREYGLPSVEQVGDLFDRNRELVERKKEQGFTRLQLTPLAMPLSSLTDRVKAVVAKHAKEGKIFQAKRNPEDPNISIAVNADEPVWTWSNLQGADESGSLLYLPESFDSRSQGITKSEVVNKAGVCAIPGWSVGLVEPSPFLPLQGSGRTIGGRRQLETGKSPREYLKALQGAPYKGETGLTIEDFLVKFATHLEETDQVSHDWNDSSAAWLLGNYQKDEASVPAAYWAQDFQQLRVSTSDPEGQFSYWGAPSTVRLS